MKIKFENTPILLPFRLLRHFADVNPIIVNYHIVSDELLPHVKNIYAYRTIKNFIKDIDFFCNEYHIISLNDFYEAKYNHYKLPDNSLLLNAIL